MLPSDEVVQLCTRLLDLQAIISLSRTSKQLREHAIVSIAQQDNLLQRWLQKAITAVTSSTSPASRQQHLGNIRWLLHQCSQKWGIIPLAARLDLQGALPAAKGHHLLVRLIIQAGARISQPLILAATNTPSSMPSTWLWAYKREGLATGLSAMLEAVCSHEPTETKRDNPGLAVPAAATPDDLLTAAAVALADPQQLPLLPILQHPSCKLWTAPQLHHLLILTLTFKPSRGHSSYGRGKLIKHLLQLPAAADLPRQVIIDLMTNVVIRGYGDLRFDSVLRPSLGAQDVFHISKAALSSPGDNTTHAGLAGFLQTATAAAQELAAEAIQQLAEAAISKRYLDVVRQLLQLPNAAAISREVTGKLLVLAIKAEMHILVLEFWEEVLDAVISLPLLQSLLALFADRERKGRLPCDDENDLEECFYCTLFTGLAETRAAQQLPIPGKLLFVKIATGHVSATEPVLALLAVEEYSPQVMQELLDALICQSLYMSSSNAISSLFEQQAAQGLTKQEVLRLLQLAVDQRNGVMLRGLLRLPAADELTEKEGCGLLRRSFAKDDSLMIVRIVDASLPAFQGMDDNGVAKLILEAAPKAPRCAKALLQLLPDRGSSLSENVVDKLLHVVIDADCNRELCSYGRWFATEEEEGRSCIVCSLLEKASKEGVFAAVKAAAGGEGLSHRRAMFRSCQRFEWSEEQVMEVVNIAMESGCYGDRMEQLLEMLVNNPNTISSSSQRKLLRHAVLHCSSYCIYGMLRHWISSEVTEKELVKLMGLAIKHGKVRNLCQLVQWEGAPDLEDGDVEHLVQQAARQGAEECVVLLLQLPGADSGLARAVAQKVQEAVLGV